LEDELEAIVLMHKYSKAALYFLLSLQALTASVLAVSLNKESLLESLSWIPSRRNSWAKFLHRLKMMIPGSKIDFANLNAE
jgi:hypothetical protein